MRVCVCDRMYQYTCVSDTERRGREEKRKNIMNEERRKAHDHRRVKQKVEGK